jgi:hypothetical protein
MPIHQPEEWDGIGKDSDILNGSLGAGHGFVNRIL